jgi:hypothetical protein
VITNQPIKSPQGQTIGEVVLAAPVEVARIKVELAKVADEAVLMGLALPVVLIKGTGQRPTVTVPIDTKAASGVSLVAVLRPDGANQPARTARYAALGLAGVFLAIFLVTILRR